jgi:NAD-dependent dihydropyrimidine dehydrogenase PreA subunit
MTYVIASSCIDVTDKSCVDECPVDCIYEGKRMLYIHPDECVDCGACEPVCPEAAIFYEGDLPDEAAEFTRINAEFFTEIGSPGGAAGAETSGYDHPDVAERPDPRGGSS